MTANKDLLTQIEDARAEELIALIDERVKIALERNEREHLEAIAGVARDVLSEFLGEFQQLRNMIGNWLAQMQALVERPFDPPARKERPN